MGVMDTAKMVNEARKARKKMSQMQVVGKEGSMAVLMNGLYEITEIEIALEELQAELGLSISADDYKKISEVFKNNIKKSLDEAKKNLEKQLASATNLEDLKNLFS